MFLLFSFLNILNTSLINRASRLMGSLGFCRVKPFSRLIKSAYVRLGTKMPHIIILRKAKASTSSISNRELSFVQLLRSHSMLAYSTHTISWTIKPVFLIGAWLFLITFTDVVSVYILGVEIHMFRVSSLVNGIIKTRAWLKFLNMRDDSKFIRFSFFLHQIFRFKWIPWLRIIYIWILNFV